MNEIPVSSNGSPDWNVLYREFAGKLFQLAERQIDRRLMQRFDANDVVQSVFRTVIRRGNEGKLEFTDPRSVLALLSKVTINKIRRMAEFHRADKRNPDRECSPNDSKTPDWLTSEPSPEDVAIFVEEFEVMMCGLSDEESEMVRLSLDGHSTSEIAECLGCSRWTVRRLLSRIGARLNQQNEGNPKKE